MAVMMTQQQILSLTEEAIKTERLRIIGILSNAGNIAQLDGDLVAAQVLGEAIMLIQKPEGAGEEEQPTESTGVEELIAEENRQDKIEFERQLGIEELPPVQLRTDEEDVSAFLSKPRMPVPLPR